MTQFPSLIDQVAAAVLAPAEVTENAHHRAIVDAFVEIQDLDRQLADLAGAKRPADVTATEQLDEPEPPGKYEPVVDEEPDFDPYVEGFDDFEDPEGPDDLDVFDEFDDLHEATCEEFLTCPSRPRTIVHACLDAFDALGAAEYVSTAELVTRLRALPGEAEGRWSYADLTPVRLALLLRPYGVQSRKPPASDGSRYRSYRRSDVLAARPNCSC